MTRARRQGQHSGHGLVPSELGCPTAGARDRLAPLPGLLSPLAEEGQAGDRVQSDLGHVPWRTWFMVSAPRRTAKVSRKKNM